MSELILRDQLAIDRTRLANQRTLLSMFRTGLYLFVIAGSFWSVEVLREWRWAALLFFFFGGGVLLLGVLNYRRNERCIRNRYQSGVCVTKVAVDKLGSA